MDGTDSVRGSASIEAVVARVWRAVLQVDDIGRRDHFLDLGGNSITAIQIISSLHDQLGVELSMREFFTSLTIAELSDALLRKGAPSGLHSRAGD